MFLEQAGCWMVKRSKICFDDFRNPNFETTRIMLLSCFTKMFLCSLLASTSSWEAGDYSTLVSILTSTAHITTVLPLAKYVISCEVATGLKYNSKTSWILLEGLPQALNHYSHGNQILSTRNIDNTTNVHDSKVDLVELTHHFLHQG